jgi:phage gpG-like protein
MGRINRRQLLEVCRGAREGPFSVLSSPSFATLYYFSSGIVMTALRDLFRSFTRASMNRLAFVNKNGRVCTDAGRRMRFYRYTA